MVGAIVNPAQRWTREHPCPVCGGAQTDPHGKGERCAGYLSKDGQTALCTREEYACALPTRRRTPAGDTWAHKLDGSCACGVAHQGGGVPALRIVHPAGPTDDKQPTWRRGPFPAEHKGGTFAGEWHYCDAKALHVVYSVVRYNLPDGGKEYSQACRHADGQRWAWGLWGAVRVLYRLAELLRSDPLDTVFVTEGERACEAVRSLGLAATTASGGALNWDQTPNARESLRGRVVVILPDHDEKGEAHARQVAGDVLSVAKSVRILRLPGLPDKGDAVEWITAGGTAGRLLQLALATPVERPAPVVPVPAPAPTPAIQPSLPSAPPVEPIELRKREEALRRVNERNRELEADNAWKRAVQANKPLAASTRMVANVVRDMLASGKADEAGWTQLYMPTVAKRAGVGDDTAGEGVRKLHECHALQRRTVTTSDDLGRVITRVLVRPGALWDTPSKWQPPKARNHGGARTCPECKSADVIVETVTRCTCRSCGTKWVENGLRRQKPSHRFPHGNSRQDDGHTLYAVKMTVVSQREVSA